MKRERRQREVAAVATLLLLLLVSCRGTDTSPFDAATSTTTSVAAPPTTVAPPTTTTSSTTSTSTTTTTTTTLAPATTTTLGSGLHPARACKLPELAERGDVGLGFPRYADRIPSTGTINGVVLFADFPDVPATRSPEDVLSIISPGAEEFFEAVSYGRMHLHLEPHLEWLTLSGNASSYEFGLSDFFGLRAHVQEAMDLADPAVDFTGFDLVVLLNNPDAAALPFGPTLTGFRGTDGSVSADGFHIRNGVVSGFDLTYWGYLWLNHEMGHSMGLVDLYSSADGLPAFTGPFSLMNDIEGAAPEFFAYERWLLRWLDGEQIACQASDDRTTELTAIEVPGGTKAVIVQVGPSKVVVVESRRALGYDGRLSRPGALVYTVDTSIESGFGPIVVANGERTLLLGESVTIEGVTVEVVAAGGESDTVRVAVAE